YKHKRNNCPDTSSYSFACRCSQRLYGEERKIRPKISCSLLQSPFKRTVHIFCFNLTEKWSFLNRSLTRTRRFRAALGPHITLKCQTD
ncbi:hypothetical protein XELAEV_18013684mg, partial [Xenopus laevis]